MHCRIQRNVFPTDYVSTVGYLTVSLSSSMSVTTYDVLEVVHVTSGGEADCLATAVADNSCDLSAVAASATGAVRAAF